MRINIIGCSDRRADLLAYHGKRLMLDLALANPVTVHMVGDLIGKRGGYVQAEDGSHTVYIADDCHTLTAVLAHELRHAQQAETGSLGEYEWQKAYKGRKHEKDANAYSSQYVASL